MTDDPYYMTPEEELRVELSGALDRIALLEGQLEDAQMTISDLQADLRMVRSARNGFKQLYRELEHKIVNKIRGPRRTGEIVNPHVLPYAEEPQPDFEAMRRATHPTTTGDANG